MSHKDWCNYPSDPCNCGVVTDYPNKQKRKDAVMSEFKEEDVIFVEFEGENPQHGIQVNDKEFVFVGSRDCSRYVEGLILGTLNTVKTSSGGSYQVYDLNDDERLNLQADLAMPAF